METAIPRVALIRADTVSMPVATVYEPRLTLVAQGSKQVELGNTRFDYDEDHYLVVSIELPVQSQPGETLPCRLAATRHRAALIPAAGICP